MRPVALTLVTLSRTEGTPDFPYSKYGKSVISVR
jgi:hypothetical protein